MEFSPATHAYKCCPLIVFTYYALLSGALGYAIVWSAEKGPVNLGSVLAAVIVLTAICTIAKASGKTKGGAVGR